MVKKTYLPEQIINKLREAEILLNQGATTAEASRKIGVTEQTYYRWRKEYGGMRIEQASISIGRHPSREYEVVFSYLPYCRRQDIGRCEAIQILKGIILQEDEFVSANG